MLSVHVSGKVHDHHYFFCKTFSDDDVQVLVLGSGEGGQVSRNQGGALQDGSGSRSVCSFISLRLCDCSFHTSGSFFLSKVLKMLAHVLSVLISGCEKESRVHVF